MSNLLGSAEWSKDQGYWRYVPIGGAGSAMEGRFLLLGECWNVYGNLHVRAPRQHVISIAPTRSGKGVSLIIPNLLNYRGSVLVVDPKGENAWVTAAWRRRAFGQKTVIVDPWNEVNRLYGSAAGRPESIAKFNPLSILDPGSDDFVEDLAYLADALIITESAREPYFDNTARELWAGLMAYVVESPAFRSHASLALARRLLMKSDEEFGRTIQSAMDLGSGSVAALKLAQFRNLKDSNSIMSVISSAKTQTAFLDSPVLNQSMESSDFSFEELCEGNISIYLVLPPDKLQTYSRWLRLMISIAIRAVARRGSQSPSGLPALFVLDEFGTIGKLNAVAQAYGLMAGLGMIMWTFSQDLNQLKRDYPDHWETFIGNSEAMTCFGVMDNFTAEYISKMLGTRTVEQKNVSSTRPSWDSSLEISSTVSTQTMSRPLLHPDEVRGLDADIGLIMGRFPPIYSRRIVYHEDWDFLHRAQTDPHFPRTENVRWRALQRRLREMGSVARLLKEYGSEVKALRRGRWEVTNAHGMQSRIFANADDLWRWTYVMIMDGVDAAEAQASLSGRG
jgi:type IV secretion system protein VirD4